MAKKKSTAAKAADGKGLNIPPTMKPEIVTFRITGISPLLQNNPAAFIGKSESADLSAGKKEYNDEEEARLRLYVDDDGNHCHPSEAFLKAMIKAVSGKKFGKLFATSTLKGSVFIVENWTIIEDEDGSPSTEYTIDRRSVVIGKSRVLRCRPCWEEWHMRLVLEVDTAICSTQNVLDALRLAGRTVGVGDYRPQCGGGFGRFAAEIGE